MGTPSLPCLRYPPSAGFCVWGRLSLTGQARTHTRWLQPHLLPSMRVLLPTATER